MRQRKDIRKHECIVFNWYVVLQTGSIIESGIRGWHFIAMPSLEFIWEDARSRAINGKQFTVFDLHAEFLNDDANIYGEITSEFTSEHLVKKSEAQQLINAATHATMLAAYELAEKCKNGEIEFDDLAPQLDAIKELTVECSPDPSVLEDDVIRVRSAGMLDRKKIDRIPQPWGLQETYHGWITGKTYLWGARTSAFKTTCMLEALRYAGDHGYAGKCLFWTLEDDNEGITDRNLLRTETHGLNQRVLAESHDKFPETFIPAAEKISPRKLRLCDEVCEIEPLIAKLSKIVRKHSIKFVAIDFLQCLPGPANMSEHDNLRRAMQALARFAKRANVAILIGTQLNQDATRRTDSEDGRPPNLGDIRGGSAVHHYAYAVLMNHIPLEEMQKPTRRMKLIIRKWKGGILTDFDMLASGAVDKLEPNDNVGEESTPPAKLNIKWGRDK